MFPIRDHNPSGRTPYVTYALIVANVLIFLAMHYGSASPLALEAAFFDWGLVPAELMQGQGYEGLLTSMFLHGGWAHLLGNMLFLYIYGDNLEDVLGHGGFSLFYLAAGLAAAAAQVLADPFSWIPMVGASGAIAGVMGGYLLLFPRAKVDVLIIIVIFFRIIPVPAFLLLGLWFLFQVVSGVAVPTDQGGVAYWAHAGGFGAGILLTLPAFIARGGPAFWRRTHGLPPHPETALPRSNVPLVRRKR
ncbi:rhomboid family intramembrane serine protease [Cereibacter johrii]|uniref:rhomboid family intramembrane serine protease n=1 Tax=Cereibacter johrii TaxID=445629 RepID=UPI000E1CE2DE|nr:rhomboid family intramembrane serine protease [Cereibacter johrii]MEA5161389.1 rhomboid family intramembrane serine protease [Cereibacter johrii]RDS96057.1 rhomboid family intramembrane serine protease [Cereibacter sphaeroides f. sp. denitrificans]